MIQFERIEKHEAQSKTPKGVREDAYDLNAQEVDLTGVDETLLFVE